MADALLPGFILEQFLWLSCEYWEWDEERGIHDGSVQWAIAVLPLLPAQQQTLVKLKNVILLSVWLIFLRLVACIWLVTFIWKQCQKRRLMRGRVAWAVEWLKSWIRDRNHLSLPSAPLFTGARRLLQVPWIWQQCGKPCPALCGSLVLKRRTVLWHFLSLKMHAWKH